MNTNPKIFITNLIKLPVFQLSFVKVTKEQRPLFNKFLFHDFLVLFFHKHLGLPPFSFSNPLFHPVTEHVHSLRRGVIL